MGIIGWIGRHLVLTLLIVAVVAGYIYRNELNEELKLREFAERHDLARYWPVWTPKPMGLEEEGDTAPSAAETPAPDATKEAAKATAKADAPQAEEAKAEEPKAEEPKAETVASAPAPAQPATAAEKTAETQTAPATEKAAAPAAEKAPETVPAAEATAETAPAPAPAQEPAKQQAAATSAAAPAAQPAAPAGDTLRADWMAARKAFWDGDLAAAEAKYIELMAVHADEPDLAGELGNMYLRQGKRDEAAAMFLEAGRRLLRGPYPVRANTVVAILNGLAPERADELRRDLFDHINQQQAPAKAPGTGQ